MAKKKPETRAASAYETAAEKPAPAPSLAAGVGALRARIEAAPEAPEEAEAEAQRGELLGVLSRLEADFARVVGGRGGKRAVFSFERVLDAAGVRADNEEQELGAFRPEAMFVPTSQEMVEAMLRMAAVTKDDVVYDLGCGDGRIIIAAAEQFAARAVGVDNDPVRIAEAKANASHAGVTRRVKFIEADLFTVDIRKATVVMLYLLPSLNLELKRRLLEQLAPGARVVSHAFDMGSDWPPAQKLEVAGQVAYLWVVGERQEQASDYS